MVTVTNYTSRKRKDGTSFQVLELTGGVELVQSQETGKFYATARRTTIPCTFDETIAKGLVGTQMKGDVVRVQVDAYDFTNPKTGELIKLQHSYAYSPEGSTELIGSSRVESLQMAQNGNTKYIVLTEPIVGQITTNRYESIQLE